MITDHSSLTPFMQRVRKVHFIGIGGVGMSGIAEVMNTIGYEVSGSDMTEGAVTEKLKAAGIKVFKGHAAENVRNADVVVTSSAISADNPEIQVVLRYLIYRINNNFFVTPLLAKARDLVLYQDV